MKLETLEKANRLKDKIDNLEAYLPLIERFRDEVIAESNKYHDKLDATASIHLSMNVSCFSSMLISYRLLLEVVDLNMEDYKKQIADLKKALEAL